MGLGTHPVSRLAERFGAGSRKAGLGLTLVMECKGVDQPASLLDGREPALNEAEGPAVSLHNCNLMMLGDYA